MNVTNLKNEDPIQSLSDEELVEKIVCNRDTLLFGVLYDRYCDRVYNKCISFSKNDDEAKDITHDVFLKLFMKLGQFKPTAKFSAWLYVFTYNHCVNYVTREKSKKIEKKLITIEDDRLLIDTDDYSLFQLKIDKLEKALELIDPEEKMILLLKYQDNISIRELAATIDVGESAIKMRLKRAKAKLVKTYNEKL